MITLNEYAIYMELSFVEPYLINTIYEGEFIIKFYQFPDGTTVRLSKLADGYFTFSGNLNYGNFNSDFYVIGKIDNVIRHFKKIIKNQIVE